MIDIYDNEIMDIVDENDCVIGQKTRLEVHTKKLTNARAVNGFIVNSSNKLLILRRSPSKKAWPLSLDMSVSGAVAAGESYEQAFKREALEELNLNVDTFNCTLLGYLSPHKDGISLFQKVYKIESDILPDYNKDEFCEHFWLSAQELLQKIETGDKSKSDLPKLIARFFL